MSFDVKDKKEIQIKQAQNYQKFKKTGLSLASFSFIFGLFK